MARRFTTGFETGEVNEHNGAQSAYLVTGTVTTTEKRTGNYGWELGVSSLATGFNYFSEVFADGPDELFIRYAYRFDVGAAIETPQAMWAVYGSDGACHISCTHNSISFAPTLVRGGSGAMGQTPGSALGTADYTLKAGRWYMIEAQVKVDNAAGTVVIKVNNTTVLSYTGDTSAGATDTIRAIRFGSTSAGVGKGLAHVWFDDIAVNDTTGNYENTWPGLGGVFLLKPNADGATTTWDTSTGTTHYTLVDDVPANTTDWIQALTTGEIDLFEMEAAPTYVNQINLVEVMYQAAVTESGYNIMTDVLRHGTVNYTDGTSTVVSVVPGYDLYKGTAYYRQPQDGTSVWGTADVNALQAGVQIL